MQLTDSAERRARPAFGDRPMKVKGWAEQFGGSDRSGSRSRGPEIASCGVGSAGQCVVTAVFARICAVVVIAGVVGVIVTG
jgi:hypothetical protein